jgi:hypothetical protein
MTLMSLLLEQSKIAKHFFTSDEKNDRDFVHDVIKINKCALWPELVDIRKNYELFLAVVRNDSPALKFPSKALKTDCKIVLAAISKNPLADRFTKKGLYLEDI